MARNSRTVPAAVAQEEYCELVRKHDAVYDERYVAPDYRRFYWQRGYGAFSVSPSQLDRPPQTMKQRSWSFT
jgi:hypothetical protein